MPAAEDDAADSIYFAEASVIGGRPPNPRGHRLFVAKEKPGGDEVAETEFDAVVV
jgi:hypothetical protein